jgi:hypothetical protein
MHFSRVRVILICISSFRARLMHIGSILKISIITRPVKRLDNSASVRRHCILLTANSVLNAIKVVLDSSVSIAMGKLRTGSGSSSISS